MIKKTYDPYTLITVRLDFVCLCYLEMCLIQIIWYDKRVIHLICVLSRGCLAIFGSIGSKHVDNISFC